MITSSKYYWIVSLVSFTLTFLLILAFFGGFDQDDYRYFFSSDTLYLPSVYQDLFVDGNTLKGWQLNPAPNIFPDMIFYSILMFVVGGNFMIASLLFALIQYSFILLLMYKLARFQFTKQATLVNLGLGNLILTLFVVHYFEFGHPRLAFQLLSNSYHLGSFVNSLLGILLVLSYLQSKKTWKLIAFAFLVFLASFSDKLFIAYFPSIALLLYVFVAISHRFRLPKSIHLLVVITVLSSLIGLSVYSVIPSSYLSFGTPYSASANLETRILSFQNQWIHFYKIATDTWSGFFIILFLSLSVIGLVIIFFRNYSKKNRVFWIALVSLFFLGGLVFIPSITGSYVGFDCIRYNIHLYFLCLLGFPFIASYFNLQKLLLPLSILFVGFYLTVLSFQFSALYNLGNYHKHYPTITQTLDELKQEYNLKNGISEYWTAKYNTLFSREKLHIYSAYFNLKPYFHVTNSNWFFTNSDRNQAIFNFVVIEHDITIEGVTKVFENSVVVERNGVTICITPDFIYDQENHTPILLTPISH